MKRIKKKKKDPRKMNPVEQAAYIRGTLGYTTFEKPPTRWLKTGSKRFNGVFGSRKLGIRYGTTIAVAGKKSSGKTWIAIKLGGIAQADGAMVFYVDVENSFDPNWAKLHGLDPGEPLVNAYGDTVGYSKIALFAPKFGIFGKSKKQKKLEKKKGPSKEVGLSKEEQQARMQTAEELFDEVERWMILQRKLYGRDCLLFGIVDSTTAIQPEEEMMAGFSNQNMRTRISNAPFLNLLTKRWCSLCPNLNAIVVYIAQLRTNPSKLFGNPEYITGGSGVLYYPHIINIVNRVKKGFVMQSGLPIGVKSIIKNHKNKAGGGSREGLRCGMKAYWTKPKWQFIDADELEGEK